MARPTTLPGEAANPIAVDKFGEAADQAPVPPTDPQGTVPEGAPPVLTLEDVIPTISLPEQACHVFDDEDIDGPDFLDDIFDCII